jgi:hypothetical protein
MLDNVWGPMLNNVWGPMLNNVWDPMLNNVWGPMLNNVWGPMLNNVWGPMLNNVWGGDQGIIHEDYTRIWITILLSEATNFIKPKQCMNNKVNDTSPDEPLVTVLQI